MLRRTVEIIGARDGVDALTTERLAQVARLPEAEVGRHVGDLAAFVRATYAAAAGDLQDRCARDLWITPSWAEGIASAMVRHLDRLAEDPTRARFCYVGVRGGDPELRRERERLRARSVELLLRYHRMVAYGEPPPLVQLELMHGAIDHAIERHIRAGTLDELRETLGDVLAAVEPDAAAFVV